MEGAREGALHCVAARMPPVIPDPREEARLAPLAPLPHAVAPAGRMRLDFGLLRRSRELRLLALGQGVFYAGSTFTEVALPLQAYRISHSTLVVGLLSLAEFVPLLITAFVGGALADAVDRRALVLLAVVGTCLAAGVLVTNSALGHARLWVLFAAAAGSATAYGLQRPSLDAIVPRIVEPAELAAASSLTSLQSSVSMAVGPLLAGFVIAGAGMTAAYVGALAAFALALLAYAAMRAVPPPPQAGELSLAAIAEGVLYARGRRDLLGTYLIDVNAMFFGIPEALVPAVATRYGGAVVVGLLYSAAPCGALLVSATSGWIGRVRRHGRAIVLAAAAWGGGIVVFGFAASLWLAVAGLAFAGGADMISGLFRMTLWNESIPDRVRGRLAGLEMLSWSSGPTLGNVEAGAAATLVGLRASIVGGGVACVLGTATIALALPALWRYDAPAGRRLRVADEGAGQTSAGR